MIHLLRAAKIGMVLLLVLLSGAAGFQPAQASDEFDSLRIKWKNLLIGGNYPAGDPDIAAQVAVSAETAGGYWSSLDKSAGRTFLWPDLADWSASKTMTASYNRLKRLAAAYSTPGSSLYGSAELGSDIVDGLDWMYSRIYNENKSQSDNWWDWQIGTPQALNDAAVLVYDLLGSVRLANYIAAVDKFVPDPTKRLNSTLTETGANRSDKAQVVTIRGILGKTGGKLAQGRDALSQIFLYVTDGDGFYRDGSFIQHTNIAYTASYGRVLLAGMSRLLYVLSGSSWQVTDANLGNVYNWVQDSFLPVLYKGAAMDMVRGRAISRQHQQDHEMGRDIVASVNRLSLSAPAAKQAELKSLVKAWVQQDTSFGSYYAGLPADDIIRLKAVLNDSAVSPAPAGQLTKIFPAMDRAVRSGPTFAFGISMSSSRIARYESGGTENLRGWHTGDGMTYLYSGDLTQFSNDYWPTVNPYRLPGTTVDSGALTDNQGNISISAYNFAGGASSGNAAAVGMRFSGIGTDLTGRKSWFLLGDKVAALGTGISSASGRKIETIVENRKLDSGGTNVFTVNGAVKPGRTGWSESMADVRWAHLAGSAVNSDIGYYFPQLPSIDGLRETRTGSWRNINKDGPTTPVTNSFLSLAFNHGINPSNASYAYVLLPGRTAAQTLSYAENPDLVVLENSNDAQAVQDLSSHVIAANFWNNITKSVAVNGTDLLTSGKQASVVYTETSAEIEIAAADPTQTNTGSIPLQINRNASAVLAADAGVTVTQLSPVIKLNVNVNKANGATFKIRLQK
ncbi:lyase [Paenibacillus chitinolyticus]|uniref:polysaccharide lyase 8 family protein n=1 Tax=Paenibacillus chitinolyticus TaxID=79263 RepID=UPI0026E4B12A|nr:polysaccharide lyase 8 family protein [Paenibacillus chitinolyticus]GKS14575.1 lyase [Paenibacillus chitinolyticus]